jgi:transposase
LLADNGKAAVIPPKANRKTARDYDRDPYKARHLIENFFAKLKQFRAIATRYDKTAKTSWPPSNSQQQPSGLIDHRPT